MTSPERITAVLKLVATMVQACGGENDDEPLRDYPSPQVLRELALAAKAEAVSLSHDADLLRGALLEANAQIDVLESSLRPPVVPAGWRVSKCDAESIGFKSPPERVWLLDIIVGDEHEPTAYIDKDGWLSALDGQDSIAPAAAICALTWAAAHDTTPPHAAAEEPLAAPQPAPDTRPVVPEDWRVSKTSVDQSERQHWALSMFMDPDYQPVAYVNGEGWLLSLDNQSAVAPSSALRALIWAAEHDTPPRHADPVDEPVTVVAADSLSVLEERDTLRARLAALEAPPVVPEGWELRKIGRPEWRKWEANHNGRWTNWCGHEGDLPIVRALAWAIEHDQRPPHADDAGEKVEQAQ